SSGKCVRAYYQAANAQQLGAALRDIITKIPNPCEYILSDAPSDPSLLSVLIDGQRVLTGSDTWVYSPGPPPKVTFVGALCTRLTNATPTSPVRVDIRALQTL